MLIACPKCKQALPEWVEKQEHSDSPCPNCYAGLEIQTFPALFRTPAKLDVARLAASEGEACCYEHTAKRAIAACGHCGRFLCGLCEVEVAGRIWCPSCLQNPGNQARLETLETSRTLYDSIALGLATVPLLLTYISVFTAPVALFVSIRYWKRPGSIVPRTKWRFVVAILVTGTELIGLIILVVFLLSSGARQFAR